MSRHTPRHAAPPSHVIPWRLIRLSLTALTLAVGALTLAGVFLALPYGPGYAPPAAAAPPASKAAPTISPPSSTGSSGSRGAPSAEIQGRRQPVPASTVNVAGALPLRLALLPPSTQASPPERAGAPLEQEPPAPVVDEPEPAAPDDQGQGQGKHDPQPDRGQDDQHGHKQEGQPQCG